MDRDAARTPVSLLRLEPPSWAHLRLLLIEPGSRVAYDEADWEGALVVLERGAIELETLEGSRCSFAPGAVLYLGRMPLRAIHNAGGEVCVLSALSRRRQPKEPR
jgi:hypothetical protein